MKETDFQKVVMDAVRAEGGYGLKLSNKFLVGVPDLLIKAPGFPTTILEAKQEKWPVRPETLLKPDVTALQAKHLREANGAGICTGVISFTHGKSNWYGVAVVDYVPGLTLRQVQYAWSTRSAMPHNIFTLLRAFWGKHG